MRPPWLVWLAVLFGALVALTTGVLGLVAPASFFALIGHSGEPVTDLTRQLAAYVGSRDLVVAVALVVLLVRRSPYLPIVMILFAATNVVDALDAIAFHRWAQLPGALLVGLIFLTAGVWLALPRHALRST